MANFRDIITNKIENLLAWGGNDPSADNINKGLLKQASDSMRHNMRDVPEIGVPSVAPNTGFGSVLWNIYRRPLEPQLIKSTDEIPSAFIYMVSGPRPSDEDVTLGNTSETIFMGIDVVLDNDYGVLMNVNEAYNAQTNQSRPLTDQINGFVYDFDVLLNATTILTVNDDFASLATDQTSPEFNTALPLISVSDAGIVNWASGVSDIEDIPSNLEIIRFTLGAIVQFPVGLLKPE